jgi:hypothetical protein
MELSRQRVTEKQAPSIQKSEGQLGVRRTSLPEQQPRAAQLTEG